MENLTDKEKAQSNEEIFKKYTEKASQDKKFENKKVLKVTTKTIIIAVSIIIIISVVAIGGFNIISIINVKKEQEQLALEKSKEVIVPNVVSKTLREAEEELGKLELNIKALYPTLNSDSPEAIIQKQYPKEGEILKKGDTVEVEALTQEQIEKKEKNKKDMENRKKTTISFAETVEKSNNGRVKYDSSQYYKNTQNGINVYKIKYITSYEKQYYYQLVSYNSDYTQVVKYTRLFLFSDYGFGESGESQELEYAYKNIFDIENTTEDDGTTYHRTQQWYDEQKEDTSSSTTQQSISSSQSSSNKSSSTSSSNNGNTSKEENPQPVLNVTLDPYSYLSKEEQNRIYENNETKKFDIVIKFNGKTIKSDTITYTGDNYIAPTYENIKVDSEKGTLTVEVNGETIKYTDGSKSVEVSMYLSYDEWQNNSFNFYDITKMMG